MKKVKCINGHFFDQDTFSCCPVCGNVAAGSSVGKKSEQKVEQIRQSRLDPVDKTAILEENASGAARAAAAESNTAAAAATNIAAGNTATANTIAANTAAAATAAGKSGGIKWRFGRKNTASIPAVKTPVKKQQEQVAAADVAQYRETADVRYAQSESWEQQSESWEQQSESWEQQSESWEQQSESWEQQSESWEQQSESWEQQSESWEQQSESWEQQSESWEQQSDTGAEQSDLQVEKAAVKSTETAGSSLTQAVAATGHGAFSALPKTVAHYDFAEIEPPAGWLVCVRGVYQGSAFECKEGKNRIGRNANCGINLIDDTSITREPHAVIIYEPKQKVFYLQDGTSDGMVYLNGTLLFSHEQLHAYDKIQMGNAEFVFLPLCGEQFTWDDYIS